MNRKSGNLFYITSPIFILVITQSTALILGRYLDALVYLPIILIYWTALALILYKFGLGDIKGWLKRPQGHWGWIVLAVLLGLSSLPLFISNFRLFGNPAVLIPHVVFFLINPWLEEFYWRGMLLDLTSRWNGLAAVLYSSVLFTAWHAAFAWYATGARGLSFFIPVLVLGVAMALIYKNTKSLWLCIGSHMLINILNMTIPVLLNLVEF
jgi:membrane protease YdiL (CAAX protease family)